MNEGLLPGVGSGIAGVRGRFAYTYVTTTQTVNGPSWARYVSIFGAAGGGGGGGGRYGTTTLSSGGGGGGGGGSKYIYRIPTFVDATTNARRWLCTIGAAGTAGAGATVDLNNGVSGGGGGNTQISFAQIGDASTPRALLGMNAVGGGGGSGGVTTNPGGGGGGACEMGQTGGTGGGGSNGVNGNQATIPTNATAPVYIIAGGQGAPGKGSQNTHALLAPCAFGTSISAITGTYSYSRNGDDAEVSARNWFLYGLDSLVRAPYPFELWFVTTCGGQAGTGGDNAAGTPAGNGGKGFNGSGGGGGGGAGGPAGSAGGNGGTGGNGFALFFWEEF